MSDQVYPVWRYHPEHPAKLVHGADEDAELLAEGWGDSTVLGPAKDAESDERDDPAPDAPKRRGRKPKA
jgi:hypothetical protein